MNPSDNSDNVNMTERELADRLVKGALDSQGIDHKTFRTILDIADRKFNLGRAWMIDRIRKHAHGRMEIESTEPREIGEEVARHELLINGTETDDPAFFSGENVDVIHRGKFKAVMGFNEDDSVDDRARKVEEFKKGYREVMQ